MEDELRCAYCRRFFVEPLLLGCGHSACRACCAKIASSSASSSSSSASSATRPCTPGGQSSGVASFLPAILSSAASTAAAPSPLSPQPSSSSGASDTMSLCVSDADHESDKLSVVSESDSGVVVIGGSGGGGRSSSRPSSMISPLSSTTRLLPPILTPSACGLQAVCGVCHKPTYFTDEAAIQAAPENVAVRNVVSRYLAAHPVADAAPSSSSSSSSISVAAPKCAFCMDAAEAAQASMSCVECKYDYCAGCFESLHPKRGPFAEHTVTAAGKRPPTATRDSDASAVGAARCATHRAEPLSMFCTACKTPVCCVCLQDARHTAHDVQALPATAQAHKAELSSTLQHLSEKARAATEDISRLKQLQDVLNNNANDFKSMVCIQVDTLVEQLQARKEQLLRHVDDIRDYKKRILREQSARCSARLARTTALVQFCIELLKEPDPAAYLQISSALLQRSITADFRWATEMKTKPEVDGEIVLTLDAKHLQYIIQTLDFAQLKVPSPPIIDADSCKVENNSVTIGWRPRHDGCAIDGFVLEIDNGRDDGSFKEVYSGAELACSLDGLHFNTVYNARVKAFNAAGESGYSEPLCLETAPVAWFQLTKSPSQREIHLSNECHTLTATTIDYHTVLGSVAFSRGVHYWEVTVDRLDGNADVVVGVAQHSVNRALMLGKDLHGWSMYIDSVRSRYLHNGEHEQRIAGGIAKGDVIGIRLDCDRGTLEFSLNDLKRKGDGGSVVAFSNLPRILFYPAFSINCKAVVTVHTAIAEPVSPE